MASHGRSVRRGAVGGAPVCGCGPRWDCVMGFVRAEARNSISAA